VGVTVGKMTTDPAIRAVAVLDDGLRGGLYEFIRRARRPITREEAAASAGISRKLAAFHLDKLVEVGLLRVRSEPLGGVRKVGRAPKLYEPGTEEIRVTIPARRHDTLAGILVDAVVSQGEGESARQAALRVAAERGEELGAAERERDRPGRLSAERALTMAEGMLAEYGFEPSRETPTCVRLRNCPFHPLVAKAPDLLCGLNQAFLAGFLTGLRAPAVEAVLAPRPAHCCVELHSAARV
jgi:predicted ArsR family transcriptional regulator